VATELTFGAGWHPVEKLGEGATSWVWLAERAGKRAALKVGRSAAHRPRFAEEAARLAGIRSPGLVSLLGAGLVRNAASLPDGARVETGAPYLVLEWVEGEALSQVAARGGDAAALATVVARDVGRALAELHAAGLAHGDVKPQNVLVESRADGTRARLVDLGLSGSANEALPRGGTRRYLAPEVMDGSARGDARLRDLFALGLSIAELLAPAAFESSTPSGAALDALSASDIGRVARALLSATPGARPSADWVARRARALLAEDETAAEAQARRREAVLRCYVAVRRGELQALARREVVDVAVAGAPGRLLGEALSLEREVASLRSDATSEGRATLRDASRETRARFLVSLVGPSAAAWPDGEWESDAALVERLLALVARTEPGSISWTELEESGAPLPRADADADAVELGLLLESGVADEALLSEVERRVERGDAPKALGLALLRALRRRGQLGRALLLLPAVGGVGARAEGVELLRRAGDAAGARAAASALSDTALDPKSRARVIATVARLELDAGNPARARELLRGEPDSAPVLETRALAELALGERATALELVDRARLVAGSDEERARIEAVRGNVAHAAADPEGALRAFRAAAEFASRAGAIVEEAFYATGVAAAATSLGELGEALASARRALLLFESLGRDSEAARSLLSLSASYAAVAAVDEAREAAHAAIARARAADDRRCAAFAHLVLAECFTEPHPEGLEHARYAASKLSPEGDDALRAAARLLFHGESGLDIARFDTLARDVSVALDARLEWWGARAETELAKAVPERPEVVCAELVALASGPVIARGPALSAGARLAARMGDGETARRLTLSLGEAARELLRRAPSTLRATIANLPWVRAADAVSAESRLSSEQLRDVESLVRALGRRDHLRALLRQVVDALVLWTGVERGLLLLRAPGGVLKPRAARNLQRSDLAAEQLSLSRSLAERALEVGEPVVAVDAAGDLPEVHASVHALKLRSVLAVPLVAHGEALGVVYLDDRVRRGAFGPAELGWVRLIATLAAVAIADARAQLLLRRAARRAQRAEAKLAVELAQREAELDVTARELSRATGGRGTRFSYDAIVGESEAVRSMLRVVDRVTTSEVPVLITGDSGSGKELVARAIHGNGPRSSGPFVSENCGAIPEGLLESTLFGHVRGAFTGAIRPRAGLFEVAHRGTLFLDEIAEMSLGMQAKLLRALQNGDIRPVGAESGRRVDVRVIGATHRDLEALVREGRFREDLYYRLNVIAVRVPSLRERLGDVPLIVRHFVRMHGADRRVKVSKAAMDALSAFAWPGNVRQLENEIRRALVLSDEVIELQHLSPELRVPAAGEMRADGLNLRQRLDTLEAELVRTALRRTEGNQTRAAELLGVSRFGLQKMMKRLEIELASAVAG
jgi:serine/threonine-protein kinase PknK